MNFYLLDENKKPYKAASLREALKIYENPDMKITKQDYIGDVFVSTVFLGIDHNYENQGDPVLWETMIFGGMYDEYQERYTSHEDALAGHQRALDLAKS